MIETVQTHTDGQKKFLTLAQQRGIDPKLFGAFVPEIKFEEEHPDPTKPTIAYLHTGGTLMMVPSKQKAGALSFENAVDIPEVMRICEIVAGVRSRYNIMGVHLANEDSKEVRSDLWTATAATVKTLYDKVEGVTIGHGTHTLEYSAAGAAYALRNLAIPIVFTASQIPIIGHPGSDGLPNLTGAMEISAHGDIAEVIAYTNGQIFRGTRTTKKNDNRLDVFEARVTGPQGYFTAAGIENRPGTRRRRGKRKHELIFAPHFSKHVTAIKLQPGMSKEILDDIVKSGRDIGIIIETYGSGAIPREMVPIIKAHTDRGYPIFVTSSCAESGVSRTMQLHDEDAIKAFEAGVRNVGDMTTSAATVKLMHVRGNMPDAKLDEVREEMIGKSYAGEINVGQSSEDF